MARLFALLVSASAAVVLQVAATPDAQALNCTSRSFTIPSWLVQNFKSQVAPATNATTASFEVFNRVTNVSSEITCQQAPSANRTWVTCSTREDTAAGSPQVLLRLRQTSASFLVNQTWSCSDRSHPISFTAAGNSSVALNCTSTKECNAALSPLLIKGSLLSPVQVTPAYSDGPLGHSTPGCAKASKSPSWRLSSIQFNKQIDDDGATIQGLSLFTENVVTGYTTSCFGFGGSGVGRRCSGQGFDFIGKERYRPRTNISFDPVTFQLSINETWYCDDENPAKPVSISGTGNTTLSLNCTERVATNETNYRRECTADVVTINGTIVEEEDLPAFSIEDPLPVLDGCTLSSVVNPAWRISAFEVDRNSSAPNATTASMTFSVTLATLDREFPFPVTISADEVHLNSSEVWYPCRFGEGQIPTAPYRCSFQYDWVKNRLALKADWLCSDLDPKNPVMFSGVMETNLRPLSCKTEYEQNQCTVDDSSIWTAPISNVTWRKADVQVTASS